MLSLLFLLPLADASFVTARCRLAPGYKIYHPNVDLDGAVCLGLRKPGAWKPVMDLKYILLGLLTILQDPNPLDPLNHEVRLRCVPARLSVRRWSTLSSRVLPFAGQ